MHQRCVAVCDVIIYFFYFHTFNRDVSRKFSSRKHFHTFTSSELSISQLTCSGFTVSLALQTPASGSAANGVILTIALAKEKKRKSPRAFFSHPTHQGRVKRLNDGDPQVDLPWWSAPGSPQNK